MELKNALSICLIALFSATLVLLVARFLDSQAASRLEPQLARIVEELQALREQGSLVSGSGDVRPTKVTDSGLVVYYFHGSVRCATCEAIESQSHETLEKEFALPLERGDIVWKVLDYEVEANADLKKQFEIQVPVVVLAQLKNGEVANWRRLDQVWALWDDKPAFAQFIRGEIQAMLDGAANNAEPATGKEQENDLPAGIDPASLPLPSTATETQTPD